jgi:hypothetical protein
MLLLANRFCIFMGFFEASAVVFNCFSKAARVAFLKPSLGSIPDFQEAVQKAICFFQAAL